MKEEIEKNVASLVGLVIDLAAVMSDTPGKDEPIKDLIQAKAVFEKAAGAVAAGKKAVADEANAAIAALEEGWKGIEAAAKKAAKKMKDQKGAWEADAKAFVEGLKAGKEMIADDPLGAALVP